MVNSLWNIDSFSVDQKNRPVRDKGARTYMKFRIDQFWIDSDVVDHRLTAQIVSREPGARVLMGKDWQSEARRLELDPDPFKKGKRIVRLTRHKGLFVKPCPGTREYVCCNLEILHIGQGCPMDCRYCALQFYFNKPVMEVFVNQDEMIDGLAEYLRDSEKPFHRICTGEFTDSLALDPLTNLSSRLVEFFEGQKRASLEIKTKTDSIGSLLNFSPSGNIVVSFSMNSEEVVKSEELRSASLERRLKAASLLERSGYRLGFHFDPIIPSGDWKDAYSKTISKIFDAVSPQSIVWISMGVLRFQPVLKEIVASRFGPVVYFHEAFNPGLDGKSRLFVERRVEVYRFMAREIRSRSPRARIYLCMESPEVWEQALGFKMPSNDQLSQYLDEAFSWRP